MVARRCSRPGCTTEVYLENVLTLSAWRQFCNFFIFAQPQVMYLSTSQICVDGSQCVGTMHNATPTRGPCHHQNPRCWQIWGTYPTPPQVRGSSRRSCKSWGKRARRASASAAESDSSDDDSDSSFFLLLYICSSIASFSTYFDA